MAGPFGAPAILELLKIFAHPMIEKAQVQQLAPIPQNARTPPAT